MNKIKSIILLGAIFIFSSCSFNKMPESWDNSSGRIFWKIFKKSCIAGYNLASDSSEEEKEMAESLCDCMVEEIQLIYPIPSNMPMGKALTEDPAVLEAREKCVDDTMGSDE